MKRRLLRQAAIALVLSIGVLVVAGGFLVAYLGSDGGRAFLFDRISEAIPGQLDAERLRFSIPAASVEVQGLTLHDASGKPIAGCKRLFVDLDGKAIWKGSVGVAQLLLDEPWAELVVDESGRLNVAGALSSPSSRRRKDFAPVSVVLQSIVVHNGSLAFASASRGTRIRAEGVEMEGRADALARFARLSLRLRQASVQTPATEWTQGPIHLAGTLEKDRIEDLRLQWDSPWLNATLSGTVEHPFGEALLDVTVSASGSLQQMEKSFGFSAGLEGRPSAELVVQGPLRNPAATVHLEWSDGSLHRIPVSRLVMDARLEERKVHIDALQITTPSGRGRLEGSVDLGRPAGHVWQIDPDALAYRLHAVVESFALAGVLKGAEGSVRSEISLEGAGVFPERMSASAEATATAEGVSVDERWPPVDAGIRTRFAFSEKILDVQELDVTSDRLHAAAAGTVDLGIRKLDVDLSVDSPNLAAGLEPLGIRGIAGRLEASARLRGPWRSLSGTGTISGSGLVVRDWTIGDISAVAGMDEEGVLSIEHLSLANQGSRLHAEGRVRIFGKANAGRRPMRFEMRFSDLEVGHFTQIFSLPGRFQGTVLLEGEFPRLTGEARVEGFGVVVSGVPLGDVSGEGAWDGTTARIRRLQSRHGSSRVEMKGDLQVLEKETLRLLSHPILHDSQWQASVRLLDFFDTIGGQVELDAAVDGSVFRPFGTVHLVGTELDFGYQKMQRLRIDARLLEDRLMVDTLQAVAAPGQTLAGSGWIATDKSFEFQLQTEGISTEHIGVLAQQEAVRGTLVAHLLGEGRLQDPSIHGNLQLSDATVNRKPVPDFNLDVGLDATTLRVNGRLNFEVEGSYDLHRRDFSLHTVFLETDLAPWMRLLGRPELSGTLTGRAVANGNVNRLRDIEVDADIADIRLDHGDFQLLRSGTGSGRLRGTAFTVRDLQLGLFREGTLTANGAGRLDGDLDLHAQGRIPVETVRLFTDKLQDLAGVVDFSVQLSGPSKAPSVQGDVRIQDAGLRPPGLGQRVQDIDAVLHFRPDQVVIQSLSAKVGGGALRLNGTVGMQALRPERMDLKLTATRIPIEVPDTLSLALDADLELSGPLKESLLEGRITVVEGEYTKDVSLNPLGAVGTKSRREAPPGQGIGHPLLRNVALDVAIEAREPLLVENNLAELELTPDFHIGGTLGKPTVQGRASVASGAITFQKKRFEVTKGVIDFVNPYKIEPIFDIESNIQIREWDIFLYLSGTPESMNFRLRSEPSASEADIVSLLIFGKTSQELARSEGGFSGSTQGMLASMIESRLGDDIKNATGLDIFGVDTGGGGGPESKDDVTVTLGKELSNRLIVKYEAGSREGQVVQRAIAEYRLLEYILLSGFQDTGGTYGGELQFRIEFR